ncbi:MAG TPA: HK97 family phage prohead protease [Candidatus Dormibacteraeota bacterium]|nr:HK97 family phage prohead protease [Candidatus Dormibacteraeota bacterium]
MDYEIRSIKGELRAAAGFKLEGIAAQYGVRSHDLGGFVETIAPGAFTRSLEAGSKVVITLNHDPNFVLGSTKAGTAKVFDSAEGLRFSVQLDRTNTMHANTYASVKRGDLDSCSFAFKVPAGGDAISQTKDAKGNPISLRTLKDVDLVDCSVVAYPAYPVGTQVDARSLTAKGLLRVASRAITPVQPPAKKPAVVARPFTEEELAKINGMTLAQFRERCDYDRLHRATQLGRKIAADATNELRARAARAGATIAADAEQLQKDEEALAIAQSRMGITCGRRRTL